MKNKHFSKIVFTGYSFLIWNIIKYTDNKYKINNKNIKDSLLLVK